MTRQSNPAGLRINQPHFVIVGSATVRNPRLSYRALGLLVYLLDQKEGWQVRSEQLSQGEGREGRASVRTALRELAVEGHYRLERRRLRNGKCVMGTALSPTPLEQWARDYQIFSTQSDPAVPVVEQEDGTFLVQYPDGTFGSDGFTPDPSADGEPPADLEPDDEDAAQERPAAPPKKPARARRPRRTPEEKAAADAEKAAAAGKRAAEKAALDEGATAGAQWWWGIPERNGQPAVKGRVDELADAKVIPRYVGDRSRAYHGVRKLIRNALAAGYDRGQVATALENTKRAFPSQQQFEDACAAAAGVHVERPRPGTTPRVPYSDEATWGRRDGAPHADGDATGTSTDDSDDATFGVITRP